MLNNAESASLEAIPAVGRPDFSRSDTVT